MLHSKVFLELVILQHSFNRRDSLERFYGEANFKVMFCKIRQIRYAKGRMLFLQIKGEFFAV